MAENKYILVLSDSRELNIDVRSLPEQLVVAVRNRILAGHFVPDIPLRQGVLAAELGVSKIPLREALTRLEEEGLLSSQVKRGYFVRPMTAGELEEIFALRLSLEPNAVAMAARHATEADHRLAYDILEAFDRVMDQDGDGLGALNRAFHLSLIRPGGQPVTAHILERLQVLSERYVRKHLDPLGRNERAIEEHRQMLQAWTVRDCKSIAALTKAHIGKTLSDLRRQLRSESL